MCRDGTSLTESGLALQQLQELAAHVEQVAQHLHAAADRALELREALRSVERALVEGGRGCGITVTTVPAAHSDST